MSRVEIKKYYKIRVHLVRTYYIKIILLKILYNVHEFTIKNFHTRSVKHKITYIHCVPQNMVGLRKNESTDSRTFCISVSLKFARPFR